MPVYEYRCKECGEKFDLFVRSATQQNVPSCPKCKSTQVQKAISLFGVGGASGDSTLNTASCSSGPT
jgi:putative FmdB family regulatory protein